MQLKQLNARRVFDAKHKLHRNGENIPLNRCTVIWAQKKNNNNNIDSNDSTQML